MEELWYYSGGGAGPVPPGPDGDDIGQSLRFRGAENLQRTFAANGSAIRTVSFWMKKNTDIATVTHLFTGGSLWSIELDSANGDMDAVPNGIGMYDGASHDMGTGSYRDPSAWYHVVATTEGTTGRIWVNGRQMYDGIRTERLFNQITIGSYSDDTFWFEGYLADVYFIDGQALLPTAFGRYNDDGVWVPRDNPNFENTQVRLGDFLTCPTPIWTGQTENDTSGAFDGQTTTFASATNENPFTFAPVPDIDFDTLEVWCNMNGNGMVQWEGDDIRPTATNDWTMVDNDGGTISADNTLVIAGDAGVANTSIAGIRINGNQILLNPFMWSGQLFATDSQAAPPFNTNNTEFNVAGPASPASFAFNGDNSNYAGSTNPGSWLVFRPREAINVNRQIRFQCNFGLSEVWINEVQQDITLNQELFEFDFDGDLENLAIRGNPASFAATLIFLQIDGQTLLNGVNNSYGANGFHLTFAQDTWSTTGTTDTTLTTTVADVSGNNNNFTANGFNIWPGNPPGIFSNGLTVPGGWQGVAPATAAFNGLDRPGAASNTSGATGTWAPNPAVQFTESFEVLASTQNWTYNGDTGTMTGFDWYPIATGAGEISADTPFVFTGDTTFANMNGVKIDGVVLVEGVNPDYDIMEDSPSQNFATLNEVDTPQNASRTPNFENANLATNLGSQAGISLASASQFISDNTGVWYMEFSNDPATAWFVGMASEDNTLNADDSTGGLTTSTTQMGLKSDGTTIVDGVGIGSNWGAGALNGGTFGLQYDSATRRLTFLQDGNVVTYNNANPDLDANNAWLIPADWGDVRFVGANYTTDQGGFNYGQQPFLFRPAALDDDTELQTDNLPDADIPNGREQFQAITGSGQAGGLLYAENAAPGGGGITPALAPLGILTQPVGSGQTLTPTGGGLSALSWIWDAGGVINNADITFLGAGGAGQTFDLERSEDGVTFTFVRNFTGVNSTQNISGANFRYVRFRALLTNMAGSQNFQSGQGLPILQAAQATFPNGLWWIKDIDNGSTNWQLACSEYNVDPEDNVVISNGNNYSPYVAPAGESVAYCWNLADTEASGCEFISDTGTGTPRTVNHNLGRVPQMIWAYNMNAPASNTVWVYHSAIGPDASLNLSNTNLDSRDIFWGGNPAQFTTTTFGVGTDDTNPSGPVYYWLWAEIPGFSAFGTYNGNSDANGPFIYTGHRPAFVLIKSSNVENDWTVFDSTRDPENPATLYLMPNTQANESSDLTIDILSNGFKLRQNSEQINNTGTQYVWASFAENPFGGANVFPANAR